jgi:GT2 family glycosyltransferase/glycosyltransferase involved in cell wall biosynthesis
LSELRNRLVAILRRLLPRSTKRALKRFWDPNRVMSPLEARIASAARHERPAGSGGGFPKIPIVCFSIFDWSFRWQRPQQFMSALARRGHPVWYVSRTGISARSAYVARRVAPNVHEVELRLPGPLMDLEGNLDAHAIEQAMESLRALRSGEDLAAAAIVVQIPSWAPIALEARREFGWRVLYDCMDDWSAFPGVESAVAASEEGLVREADAVLASSRALAAKWSNAARRLSLVRNGADPEHFRYRSAAGLLAQIPRPVAGYVGAIAEWFDVELVQDLAHARPDWHFVLIGRASVDVTAISSLSNVHFLGEKPYEVVPAYVSEFDVCLIPFRVDALTAATDPVKFYEYLSAGRPVIATPLPELEPHRDVATLAPDAAAFAAALDGARRDDSPEARAARRSFAIDHSWDGRVDDVERILRDAHPSVSIVIVTWNNLEYTKLCLESLVEGTFYPDCELVIVDNASGDGTVAWIETLPPERIPIRLLRNETNRGFAAAVNQGLAAATGEVLIILNNDTMVPPGWLTRLTRHLADPHTGLVVPVTNFSGNESRIDVSYRDPADMRAAAKRYVEAHEGEAFDIDVAAMYCTAMRRDVFEALGPLDERFGIGMFEDDDYSRRARAAGYRVLCAEDAFVHHFGEASFSLLPNPEYRALFDENRRRFEEKWGEPWKEHKGRAGSD